MTELSVQMASEGGTAVSIEQLSLPQLDQLKTQLNEVGFSRMVAVFS